MKDNGVRSDTSLNETTTERVAKEKNEEHYRLQKRELSRLSEEAKHLLAQKRYSAALIVLFDIASKCAALRDDPTYLALQADALSWIGFVYRQLKRVEEGLDFIDEAVDMLEELHERHRRFAKQLAKAYVNEAAGLLETEGHEAAHEAFLDALHLAMEHKEDPCLHVDILYEGAMLFKDPEYITKAKNIVHLCDEKSERIWIKKLNHLEKRLQRMQREH